MSKRKRDTKRDYRDICYFVDHVKDVKLRIDLIKSLGYNIGVNIVNDSGKIKVDGDEIVKAKWFKKEEIIRYPSDISISDWLVQDFIDSQS